MSERTQAELLQLLDEAVSEMRNLISMMEPYYSQCEGDKEACELIARIEEVLPPPPPPYVAPPLCCDQCEGKRAERDFKTKQALNMHKAHVHFVFNREATQ